MSEMTLEQVRDGVALCAYRIRPDGNVLVPSELLAKVHEHFNAILASQPAEQPRIGIVESISDLRHHLVEIIHKGAKTVLPADAEYMVHAIDDALDKAEQARGEYPECSGDASSCPENEGYGCCGAKPRGEPVVNCQDERDVFRALSGLKGKLFDANALDSDAVALHSAGRDAFLRIVKAGREAAKPKPEQAVGDSWEHAANEWADVATNGVVVLENVRDGLITFDEAIAEWKANVARARATPRPAVATPSCMTCNGRGEIGGFVSMDSGHQTDPCPNCATPAEVTDEKGAFEMWVRSWMLGDGDADRALARNRFDDYPDDEINLKYIGWMGRAALASLSAGAVVPDGWQPIETAPNDGTKHVRGLHVYSSTDGAFLYWDAVAGYVGEEDGIFYNTEGDVSGWGAQDYTHWFPLPVEPKADATSAGRMGVG